MHGLVSTDLQLDAVRWQRAVEPTAAFVNLSDFISARASALRDALERF